MSVYDTWFGLYGDFKKGTLRLPYGKCRHKWVNGAFGIDNNKRKSLEATNDNEKHPLRVLSEENLTVVSSFAGSSNNLVDGNDFADPSKLSFFKVPDFSQMADPIARLQ